MNQKHQNVPIWEKANLTLEEAAAFTNIGINKLRQLTDEDGCEYVLWIGSKRLIKRKKLEEFLEHAKNNDFCFIENTQVPPEKVKKLYLFHWNRIYPSDFSLKLPMDTYKIIQTEDFIGSSHEKITLEVYDCE